MKSSIPWIISLFLLLTVAALAFMRRQSGESSRQPKQPVAATVRENMLPTRTIAVVGEGTVDKEPDTAEIGVRVTMEMQKFNQTWEAAAKKMHTLTEKLKTWGIEAKDVRTVDFNVWQNSRPIGYGVSHDMRVTVRDLKSLGSVLDAISERGIYVQGITFGLTYPDALKSEARAAAMADARRKAEQLVGTVGATLGAALRIDESVQPLPATLDGNRDSLFGLSALGTIGHAGDSVESTTIPVQFGQLKMSSQVTVVYSME